MHEIIKKADVLIEALPYIQRFRGSIVVVKFGGSAMESADRASEVLTDIAFMECVGMRVVVVHGGGKAISRQMDRKGIKSSFVKGLRVTCEKSIKVVEEVLKSEINSSIVNTLKEAGAKAACLDGETLFTVIKKKIKDKTTGETLDWGFVGEPEKVNIKPILAMLDKTVVPVITPLGLGPDRKIHNINADTAAAAVAQALKARKLVFLSDVPGLLRDKDDPESIMSTLKVKQVEGLVKKGIIDGGMLPKVEAGVAAIKAGVRKVHMVDGRMPHSLLLEIFTDKGVGTQIVE